MNVNVLMINANGQNNGGEQMKNKMKKWKKGAMLGALIGGGWLVLGGIINVLHAYTGSTPSSWKFMIDAFPLYTLLVPLGIVDFGQRLAPPGLSEFIYAPVVALYWATIGAVIGYLYQWRRER